MSVADDGGNGTGTKDRIGGAGDIKFMANVVLGFGLREAGEIVVNDDTLAERLMNGFFEYIVEMRLAGKRQSEAVQGIEIVIEILLA